MKYLATILLVVLCNLDANGTAVAQETVLPADRTLAIPKVEFDAKGDLKITA